MSIAAAPLPEVFAELRRAHEHLSLRAYDAEHARTTYDEAHAHSVALWYIHEAEPAADRTPTLEAITVYRNLIAALERQLEFLVDHVGIDVTWTADDPYTSSADMFAQVAATGRLRVFKSIPGAHAVWTERDNDIFRAVHDLLGHCAWGNSFGPKGEDAAYRSHAATLPFDLLPAVASETRGQNATFNYGPLIDGRPRRTYARQSWLPAPDWVCRWNL